MYLEDYGILVKILHPYTSAQVGSLRFLDNPLPYDGSGRMTFSLEYNKIRKLLFSISKGKTAYYVKVALFNDLNCLEINGYPGCNVDPNDVRITVLGFALPLLKKNKIYYEEVFCTEFKRITDSLGITAEI